MDALLMENLMLYLTQQQRGTEERLQRHHPSFLDPDIIMNVLKAVGKDKPTPTFAIPHTPTRQEKHGANLY
eukprot:3359251-Ditylum_brightwellii.AAC.1